METTMTEAKGSALSSLAILLLSFGGVLLLHEWSLLPAPQNLLPLLLVYIGVRGARHTQRGARVVSLLIALFGVITQVAIFQDLPDSELGLLRPLAGVTDAFDGPLGFFARLVALGLVLSGVLLLMRARRASAPPTGASAMPSHAAPPPASPGDAPADHGFAPHGSARPDAGGDSVDSFAIFSGVQRSVAHRVFRGGRLIAVFGGLHLDLSEATMTEPEARLDVFSIFGGAEINVPPGCDVVMRAVPIFGGVDMTKKPRQVAHTSETGGRIVVSGLALFGGIDVTS
jgi:hypothetical protein